MESKEMTTTPAAQSMSERFTDEVMRQFGTSIAPMEISDKMRQFIMGYFIGIDTALKTAEEARLRKPEANRDPVPVTWANVNLTALAVDVMHYARIGLDMSLENMLWAIPYKNNKTGKYDITLMEGYNGIQYISERYALHIPVAVTIQLVYANDTFVPIMRSKDNPVESYLFEIDQPFDRGEIVGGFGYVEFDEPRRNRLIIMTRAQIEKRKPAYASPEFWGGEKDKWEGGKKAGKIPVEGWFDEMCLKTLKREVYSAKHMPRDPDKIDEHYRYIRRREAETIEAASRAVVEGYGEASELDVGDAPALPEGVQPDTGEITQNSHDGDTAPAPGQTKMEF